MLQDQGQDGRPEEGGHSGRGGRQVGQLRLGGSRHDVRRDGRRRCIPGLDDVARAFLDRLLDELLVDGIGERMREDARVVLLDRVGLIDEDVDDRTLASSECRFRVRRGDHDDVDLAREQPSLGRRPGR